MSFTKNFDIISESLSLAEQELFPSDPVIEEIWVRIYIKQLEEQIPTNDIITEIIQNSISERVLSLYTAFLCIPEIFIPCEDCEDDENLPVSIAENKLNDRNILQAYPNPFSNSITIEANFNESTDESIIQAAIYSVTGQKLFIFDLNLDYKNSSFVWNGNDLEGNSLAAGVYIFVMHTSKQVYQIKLIKK